MNSLSLLNEGQRGSLLGGINAGIARAKHEITRTYTHTMPYFVTKPGYHPEPGVETDIYNASEQFTNTTYHAGYNHGISGTPGSVPVLGMPPDAFHKQIFDYIKNQSMGIYNAGYHAGMAERSRSAGAAYGGRRNRKIRKTRRLRRSRKARK